MLMGQTRMEKWSLKSVTWRSLSNYLHKRGFRLQGGAKSDWTAYKSQVMLHQTPQAPCLWVVESNSGS